MSQRVCMCQKRPMCVKRDIYSHISPHFCHIEMLKYVNMLKEIYMCQKRPMCVEKNLHKRATDPHMTHSYGV